MKKGEIQQKTAEIINAVKDDDRREFNRIYDELKPWHYFLVRELAKTAAELADINYRLTLTHPDPSEAISEASKRIGLLKRRTTKRGIDHLE